jgi:hypothetical protein
MSASVRGPSQAFAIILSYKRFDPTEAFSACEHRSAIADSITDAECTALSYPVSDVDILSWITRKRSAVLAAFASRSTSSLLISSESTALSTAWRSEEWLTNLDSLETSAFATLTTDFQSLTVSMQGGSPEISHCFISKKMRFVPLMATLCAITDPKILQLERCGVRVNASEG